MAIDDIGFNQAELRILALLGDEKGHAQWEICDKLKIDKAYASKTLKGLKNRGLIFSEERSLIRPRKERGPHTEHPYYIQKDQLPIITKTILIKIKRYLSMYQSTRSERELLRVEGTLTPTLESELSSRALSCMGAADIIMMIFRDTLYRDCLSKIHNMDHITYDAARDLIYSDSGIIWLHEKGAIYTVTPDKKSPVEAFQTLVSNIEYAKEVEAERRSLETDPIALQKIKDLWNKGRTNIYKDLGYSQDTTIAQINQMLDCGEIS